MKQEKFRAVLCCCRKQHLLVRGSLSPLGLDSLNNKHLFLRVLEAEKSKNKAPADLVSCESRLWFIDCCLLTGSFHMAVAVRELSVVYFLRALTHPHDLITSQRGHFEISSHWGLGFHYMSLREWGRDRYKRSVINVKLSFDFS